MIAQYITLNFDIEELSQFQRYLSMVKVKQIQTNVFNPSKNLSKNPLLKFQNFVQFRTSELPNELCIVSFSIKNLMS
jgi:hypothetical protein